ncbi:MAG TPA: hypothetical protein DCM21_10145 [Butyrivibrio sp.]|nr:hypothetical protein [Butyrivibrio sp.]
MSPFVNLYPKGGNRPKRVENPGAAGWKSLPKLREIGENGRDSRCAACRKSLPKLPIFLIWVENPGAAGCKSLPK